MNAFCALAKKATETYIIEGKVLSIPKKIPADFKKKAGVFVTIFNGKELRGCIGTYLPTTPNMAQEIIDNAISAATRDWRFRKIYKGELTELSYEVSILEKPVIIKNLEELDPARFGIIVRGFDSGRSALLLPNLEGLDTREKQLAACLSKAGINPAEEQIAIFKFKTQKYDANNRDL